jgi:multidrug efflux pump
VVAVGLVLSAVFVPCAFISGITGQFFRQFALTIAASTVISAFNSLTLSPALTALLLRPRDKETAPPLPRLAFAVLGGWAAWLWLTPHVRGNPWAAAALGAVGGWLVGWPLNRLLGAGFRAFNAGFVRVTGWYTRAVGLALRGSLVALLVYAGLLFLTYDQFRRTPKGFIPAQDMGYLMVNVQLPDSASMERTERVMRKLQQAALKDPGILHATYIAGQSFVLSAAGSNFGSMFINLKDYADRRTPDLSSDAIANRMRVAAAQIPSAMVGVFGPPPVRGVGRAGGFALMVEDRGDVGPHGLQKQAEAVTGRGMQLPGLVGLFTVFRANVPQLHVDPNPRECMAKGVSLKDFAETLQVYEGSLYVNDFNRFGRTWQVIVQAEAENRDQPEDLVRLQVRNRRGAMVPLGSLARVREVNGPLVLTRYNMYPAAAVNGMAAPGMSSGQVMEMMQQLCGEVLPQNMSYEWTDISFLEQKAGNTAMIIFAFAVVMVFLVLAAQYESWSLPLAVILVVPMCLLCAITGVNVARMDINIFTQVGFVVLVGLASKNAILIVEFAKVQHERGAPLTEATLEACKLRLRPIIMTSFAFILGVLPLLVSHGAGMEMRRALGVAVFSGMLGVTLFGVFLTPVFFYAIGRLSGAGPFAVPAVRRAGAAALDVLRLGPVWRAGAAAWRRGATGRKRTIRVQAPTPKDANGDSPHPPAPVARVSDH